MRQFFGFVTTTTRQRDNVIYVASGTSQGPEKNRKIVRPQCLDGVATINIVKWQLQTTLWPDNMVTLHDILYGTHFTNFCVRKTLKVLKT